MKNRYILIFMIALQAISICASEIVGHQTKRQKIVHDRDDYSKASLKQLLMMHTSLAQVSSPSTFPIIDCVLSYTKPSWQKIGNYKVKKIAYKKTSLNKFKQVRAECIMNEKQLYWQKLLPLSVTFTSLHELRRIISSANTIKRTKEFISDNHEYKIAAECAEVTVYRQVS